MWVDENNRILYQHFEKKVASKQVLSANSAQSSACKRSVHTQELVRRLMNTSTRLDWDLSMAPVLDDYMKRMQIAGYGEEYRRNVLVRALAIYDRKVREHSQGIQPLHRPRCWQAEERKKNRRKKKYSWSSNSGCIAPIFVPSTPQGELAKELRKIVEHEGIEELKFKIVETGGRSVQSEIQKSNPTKTNGCENMECIACQEGRGRGGNCMKSNVTYEMECRLCPEGDKCIYVGETSRNLFTRTKEHMEKYRSERRNPDSFIKQHQVERHQDVPAEFSAKVTGSFKDCLSRQVSEAVQIRRSNGPVLNSKSEWHQPPLWQVQSEIFRS